MIGPRSFVTTCAPLRSFPGAPEAVGEHAGDREEHRVLVARERRGVVVDRRAAVARLAFTDRAAEAARYQVPRSHAPAA